MSAGEHQTEEADGPHGLAGALTLVEQGAAAIRTGGTELEPARGPLATADTDFTDFRSLPAGLRLAARRLAAVTQLIQMPCHFHPRVQITCREGP